MGEAHVLLSEPAVLRADDRQEAAFASEFAAARDTVTADYAERFRRNVTTFSLVCLVVLAVIYTLFLARDVFMPIAMAFVLKLLLNPGVRLMAKGRVPASVGALIMTLLFIAALCGVFYMVASPGTEWLGRAPQWLPVLQAKLKLVAGPLTRAQHFLAQFDTGTHTGEGDAQPNQTSVSLSSPTIVAYLFTGTRSIVTLTATMLLLLYFLLAAGDIFLRRLVEVLPRLKDKKRAVEMVRQVEKDISTYLVTITIINGSLGLLTGIAVFAIGMPDPLLWGVLVFVLNYLPYLGPGMGICILTIAGLMSLPTLEQSLLVPGFYVGFVIVEGQFVTPMVLARRLTLNPVALFMSLLLWGFLWGIPGALLAVPMLAIFKILCDRVPPLSPIGHFLGE